MMIAVVYNRGDPKVLRGQGVPNREIIHERTVAGVVDGLQDAGHDVVAIAGDKRLVRRLETFLARAEGAGKEAVVFNIAYGIQGRDRYTHVPAILEMLGVPYVGSGPAAHSFALDKAHTKMVLEATGVPTPPFSVVHQPDEPLPEMDYPVIAKPKREAMSLGLRVCKDEDELRAALEELFGRYRQPMLVEQYIEGRELFVGVLGNGKRLESFPAVELEFLEGEHIIRREDKEAAHEGKRLRDLRLTCPADIEDGTEREAEAIARRAFEALECCDMARVDLRLGEDGRLWVLEVNSIPGLDDDGPYAVGGKEAGYDFPELLDAIVQAARTRYRRDHEDLVPQRVLEGRP